MPELTLHEEKIMLQFIKCKDFESAYDFIKSYPEIVSRDISDSLLARAFRKQMNGEEKEAYQCCRWSLVLNYCMNLGSDGVSLFFKRMNAVAALQVFEADFDQTWKRIQERCRVLKQKDEEKEYDESNSNLTPEQAAVFKTFPKDFQKAMISGEVEQINAAFSKMSEEQYKEVMEQCQKCGLISVLSKEEADAMVEQEKKAEPEQVSAN
jgi:cell division cycle protein 37